MRAEFSAISASGRRSASWVLAVMVLATGWPDASFGQTWTTGYFRSADGYGPSGGSLSGAPTNVPVDFQWQTTDPNEVNAMFHRAGWTLGLSTSGNKSTLFGGYNAAVNSSYWPGVTDPVLYRNFSNPVTLEEPVVVVSLDFGILPTASASFTNKDVFSFEFLNTASNLSMAKFSLNPATATDPDFMRLEWTRNGTNVVSDGSTFQSYQIQYTALYRMLFSISEGAMDVSLLALVAETNGVGTVTNFAVASSNWVVQSGLLSEGLTAQDFDQFAINWDLSSGATNQPGGNYMNLNTVSLTTAVPEPSTIVLLLAGLGVVGLVAGRRRRP